MDNYFSRYKDLSRVYDIQDQERLEDQVYKKRDPFPLFLTNPERINCHTDTTFTVLFLINLRDVRKFLKEFEKNFYGINEEEKIDSLSNRLTGIEKTFANEDYIKKVSDYEKITNPKKVLKGYSNLSQVKRKDKYNSNIEKERRFIYTIDSFNTLIEIIRILKSIESKKESCINDKTIKNLYKNVLPMKYFQSIPEFEDFIIKYGQDYQDSSAIAFLLISCLYYWGHTISFGTQTVVSIDQDEIEITNVLLPIIPKQKLDVICTEYRNFSNDSLIEVLKERMFIYDRYYTIYAFVIYKSDHFIALYKLNDKWYYYNDLITGIEYFPTTSISDVFYRVSKESETKTYQGGLINIYYTRIENRFDFKNY